MLGHSIPTAKRWIIALVGSGLATLHAANPTISSLVPGGLQRGTETKVEIKGDRLADFEDIFFYTPGLSVTNVEKKEGKLVTTTIKTEPNVALGRHLMRIRTATGISRIRPFFVGQFPEHKEAEPNSTLDAPNEAKLNHSLSGVIETEDVDYWKLPLKKDQRVSLEIEGWRFGYSLFDPYIAILDTEGRTLKIADDSYLNQQDGYCEFIAPADGTYLIEVRETSYLGRNNSFYRLHLGDFPRPAVVFPAGGKAGSEVAVRYINDDGSAVDAKIPLPKEEGALGVYAKKGNLSAPSPNWIRVSPFDNALEKEPNNKRQEATPVGTLPIALNGIISEPGDYDSFKISLKKDQQVLIAAHARSLRSSLDAYLRVRNKDGKALETKDDNGNGQFDPSINFKAPADGDYFVEIEDRLKSGSPTHVYRIEIAKRPPSLTLTQPMFRNNDSHTRQYISIPKGGRYATRFNMARSGVKGHHILEIPNLPQGVKLITPGHWREDQSSLPVILEAAADAPLGGALCQPLTRPVDPEVTSTKGNLNQKFDLITGAPGYTVFYDVKTDLTPIAVCEKAPYSLSLSIPKTPIVRNGRLPIKITAVRDEGFKAAIKCHILWRPSGVNSQNEVTIAEGKNEATFNLDANNGALEGDWKLAVMGEAAINGGPIFNAAPFATYKVEQQFVNGKLKMTTVEQGRTTTMEMEISHVRPFEGKAKASLIGLPRTATAEPLEFTKDTKSLTFTIKTTAETPTSTSKGVFCTAEIPSPNGTIPQTVASGGVLRVDPPRLAQK